MTRRSDGGRNRFLVVALGLLALLLAATGPAAPVQAAMPAKLDLAKLRAEHPRIFFNAQSWPAIKAHALGPERPYLDRLVDGADELLTAPLEADDYGRQAATAALAHLVLGDNRLLALAKELLARSLAFYRAREKAGQAVSWYATSRIDAICAYDWLYPKLTPTERQRFGRDILEHVAAIQPGPNKKPIPGENVGNGPETGFYGVEALLWYAGLATSGERIDDNLAKSFLEDGFERQAEVLAYRRQVAGDDGGAGTMALNYGLSWYPWAEFNFLHTLESAFGLSVAAAWPHLALLPNYVFWNLLPGNHWFGAGDSDHETNKLPDWELYTHLAQVRHFYGQSHPQPAALAGWLMTKIEARRHSESLPVLPLLLTRAKAAPKPAGPEELGLPLARFFEKTGQIFFRSGSGPEDTYLCLTAGGVAKTHRHYDENNLVIYHRGFLALDSGTRPEPGSHLNQYYCRTVAHNCVTIRMDGETLPAYWGEPAPGEPDLPTPNDGGQNALAEAKVVAFESNHLYAYAASDAAKAYDHRKCKQALRQVVFVPPRWLVVFDRVVSARPEQRKTWLLHTAKEPSVFANGFVADQGQGRLYARTFLPREAKLTKVGGPLRTFWNDGRNWSLPRGFRPQASAPLYGEWRVEVTPGQAQAEELFLHLFQTAAPTQTVQMAPAAFLEGENQVGVEFKNGEQTVAVIFARAGLPAGRIKISGPGVSLNKPLASSVQAQAGLAGTVKAAK